MIGRTNSTSDRFPLAMPAELLVPTVLRGNAVIDAPRRPSGRCLAGVAAFLTIVALMSIGGSPTILAQVPPRPKATVKGVVPATAPQAPAPSTAKSDLMPDMGQEPQGSPPANPGPPPSMDDPRPRRDDSVRPTELDDKNPLPPSLPAPGGAAPTSTGGQGAGPDPFALPVDRMSIGKQRVQLSVEVQASPIINLGKESTVRLVVKNESNADASGVSLVYQLPEGLKINTSTPEAAPIPGDKPLFHWAKPMLAAGGEWVVVLKVVAISTKACEHAATVTAKTGSRANTIIQEPKLKVEATSSPGRVLKGEQVKFDIAVRNPGTGPARNVIVQAKLSSGLRLGSDDIVEQVINEIGPGQRVDLDSLTVDTVAGGEQTCTVEVRSPDVNPVVEDQRITRKVEVTTPALTVKLEGHTERFTGQTNDYKLSVKNPGTAPAKKVKVAVTLPKEGGQLIGRPTGAKFVLATRQLLWSIAQLEPGQTVDMSFNYATSTPGLYRASAEVTAGELRATDTMATDVSGIAVLDLNVSQEVRVMDIGKSNYYDITIKNVGTKEATKILLNGKLTPNLTVTKHFNVDKGDFVFKKDGDDKGRFIFPVIERLAVGQTITLSLEVQATASGPAGCHVFLAHDEMANPEDKIEDVISTTVTGNSRIKAAAAKP